MPVLLDRLKAALADRYAIQEEIGAGGMATVYLAEDLKHERQVAVKVLRPDLAAALGPERFLREIKIAAQLHHPHILPLYDSAEADGFLYYVMPYEEGQSLREKLAKEGELPVTEAVRLLRDVVDALAHAHKHGVVHRDIKPDNVLLSDRHALVTDFGVAKAVSEATGREKLTTAGVALGTPAYMAPEQAVADPNTDHRADIYAVGALAYELLTGRPPFTGTTPQMILSAHVTEAPEPVTKHRTAVPPELASLVMKCLEKKPADRWQSAEELLPQLEALATPSGGITPTGMQPVDAVPRPTKAKRSLVGGAVAAVGLVGVGFAAMMVLRGGEVVELAGDRVLMGIFANETGDPTHDPLGKIVADWLSRGLHGTGFVDVVDERSLLGNGAASEGPAGPARLRTLAEEAGAGLIVWGNYYLITGDSLQLQGQVLDARDGSIIRAIGPMTALVSAPQSAIGELRDRMMGAFANILDPRFGAIAPGINPPSYQAYQEFVAGDEAFYEGRMPESARRLMTAYYLDTTFVVAAVRAAVAYQNFGQCATVDSIGQALQAKRQTIAPYDRYYLDRIVARCHGDYQEHLKAAEEMMRVAPKSPFAQYVAGRSALWVNRVEYGLSILEPIDASESELRNSYDQVMRDVANAYHMLDDYQRELALFDRWDNWAEVNHGQNAYVRALAGLGRFDESRAQAERAASLSGSGGAYWASDIVCLASREIWAHGGTEEARPSSEACLASIERWGVVDADTGAWYSRAADALYRLDRLEEARSLYETEYERAPRWLTAIGRLGLIAAKTDGRDAADTWDAMLAGYTVEYGPKGGPSLWRAKIALALGDRDRGVALIRQAMNEGINFWSSFHGDPLHVDIDLAPLFGYPPYEEIVAPKQ